MRNELSGLSNFTLELVGRLVADKLSAALADDPNAAYRGTADLESLHCDLICEMRFRDRPIDVCHFILESDRSMRLLEGL